MSSKFEKPVIQNKAKVEESANVPECPLKYEFVKIVTPHEIRDLHDRARAGLDAYFESRNCVPVAIVNAKGEIICEPGFELNQGEFQPAYSDYSMEIRSVLKNPSAISD
jgi:hypothetical protein